MIKDTPLDEWLWRSGSEKAVGEEWPEATRTAGSRQRARPPWGCRTCSGSYPVWTWAAYPASGDCGKHPCSVVDIIIYTLYHYQHHHHHNTTITTTIITTVTTTTIIIIIMFSAIVVSSIRILIRLRH